MSSDQETFKASTSDYRDAQVQNIEENVAKIEEKMEASRSLVRDVTKFLNPLAASSPLSRSRVDVEELKMHLQSQDYKPSRSEPFSFAMDAYQRSTTSDKNSSSSDKEDIPSILKKKDTPLNTSTENVKEINVYHSGGVLIMQHFKEPTSDSEKHTISEVSAKLIEDCQKLSEDLKEVEAKPEGKFVQFDLTPAGSPDAKRGFSGSPFKDANNGNLRSRVSEQPSSLSTNESLPWQQVGPSSPSSTASARRLEWDSGADVGYLNMDMSKDKLSTIERVTLQGITMRGIGEKKVVYKTSRGDRVLERVPSDLLEVEERKPIMKDTGTNPDIDSGGDGSLKNKRHFQKSDAHSTEETDETLQVAETSENSGVDHKSSPSSDQLPAHFPEVKDESTFVNTLGSEFEFTMRNRIESSPKQRRKRASPKLKKKKQSPLVVRTRSEKLREVIELARAGNSECESRVDELIVDHSFRGEIVSQSIGRNALTSASSGSNITVLSKPEDMVMRKDKLVQTSDRAYESKGIQAVENAPHKLTSCKSIQASGELNSLPKHLDAKERSAMSGQEVRTKSTQFFGGGANSLPKALDKANRTNKTPVKVQEDVAHVKENKEEPLAGPSGVKVKNKEKSDAKLKGDGAAKSPEKLNADSSKKHSEKGHGSNSSKNSVLKKSNNSSGKSGELTVERLRQRDDTVDPSILQNKYFDSQKREMVTRSTSMDFESASAVYAKESVTVGIQYSSRNEKMGGRKNEEAVKEFWTDTLDSQASSTQTAHSWVHEGAPRRNSVVRPTRSFEYLPGEVYESRGNLRETLPSETSQNVITESSSSESEPPLREFRRPSDSEGAALSPCVVEEPNQRASESSVGGGTVVLENSDCSDSALHAAWLVLANDSVQVHSKGLSEGSRKSSLTEDMVRRKISSIAVQTEALDGSKETSRKNDDSLKRMLRDLCDILLNDRRSRHHTTEIRSLDRNTLLSLQDRTDRCSNVSDTKSGEEREFRKFGTDLELEIVTKAAGTSAHRRKQEGSKNSRSVKEAAKEYDKRKDSSESPDEGKNNVSATAKMPSILQKETNVLKNVAESTTDSSVISTNIQEPTTSSTRRPLKKGKLLEPQNSVDISLSKDKICACRLQVPNGKQKDKKGEKKKRSCCSKCISSNEQLSKLSVNVPPPASRACSTPNTQADNKEKLKKPASSGTPSYSSCPSASGETSGSILTNNGRSETSETSNLSRESNLASKHANKSNINGNRGKSVKAADDGTQRERRIVHQATQVSDSSRFTPSSQEFNDKGTQLSGSSLCYCPKCRSDSCTCLQQVDAGTQMSETSRRCSVCKQYKCFCKEKNYQKESSSAKASDCCRKCKNESCTCLELVSPQQIDMVAQISNTPRNCCDCKQHKCSCEMSKKPSRNTEEGSTGKSGNSQRSCQKCGNESCTCLLLILSPQIDEEVQASKTSRRCCKCNQYGCCCNENGGSDDPGRKGVKVINGHHFDGQIEVDLSSSEPSSLSSNSGHPSKKKPNQRSEGEHDRCAICLCSDGFKQQCIFCPCHIDKKMHIPRCDCHEQAVPKFLIPGFCKCHKRNLEYFQECFCAEAVTGTNCPCCETFYRHMRKMIYEKQMKETMPVASQKVKKLPSKNYFLKLEETEVSKDSSDVSEPEKKPVEVITIKIPVKRCGKAKLPSKNFYYAQSSREGSSERQEKDVEYLDDIIKKYATKKSSEEVSERSKSNGKSGGTATRSERNGATSGSSYRTLQEWLESNRPDFFNSAETRRNVILERAKDRENNKENRVQRVIKACPVQHNPCPLPARIFTTAQMKQQTLRKYKQLCEVRKRKDDRKKSEEHRRNKLMADIFAKKLQLKTLRADIPFAAEQVAVELSSQKQQYKAH